MITVLGSINMDLIATTSRLPKPGETVTGQDFATAAGGKGANQALAAQRAGSQVRMIGAVGKDGFAEDALALLKQSGASLDAVAVVEGSTGTALILVGGDGENMIAVVAGANAAVAPQHAAQAVDQMAQADILMLQMEVPASTVEAALNAARQKGIRTLFNTAPLTEDVIRLAPLASILVSNETEFELLLGRSNLSSEARLEAMKKLAAETGQTIVVTLGADGVVAIHENKVIRAKGLKITPVDTVGAGDTFCGYLAAGLDQGLEFAEALGRAAAAGSLACLKAGAQPSVPLAAEVSAALQ